MQMKSNPNKPQANLTWTTKLNMKIVTLETGGPREHPIIQTLVSDLNMPCKIGFCICY